MMIALATILLAAVPAGLAHSAAGDHASAAEVVKNAAEPRAPTSSSAAPAESVHSSAGSHTPTAEATKNPAIRTAPPSSWSDIAVQTRYVMIMGTMDAAAASRLLGATKGPLCPGSLNNIDLDTRIAAEGYNANGGELEAALRATIAKNAQDSSCDDTKRRYDLSLVRGMSDDHLSAYISQAVATLDLPADCTLKSDDLQDMQGLAARLAGGMLTAEDENGSPAAQIAKTTAEACKQPRDVAKPGEQDSQTESS